MRRKDREITDRGEMEALLDKIPLMYMGLCDGNEPYTIPLNFVRDGDKLYFHCAKQGRKLEVISRNPSVCVCVSTVGEIVPDYPAPPTTHYESVIITGRAAVVDDENERMNAFNLLMQKFGVGEQVTLTSEGIKNAEVVRIAINSMTGKRNPNF